MLEMLILDLGSALLPSYDRGQMLMLLLYGSTILDGQQRVYSLSWRSKMHECLASASLLILLANRDRHLRGVWSDYIVVHHSRQFTRVDLSVNDIVLID